MNAKIVGMFQDLMQAIRENADGQLLNTVSDFEMAELIAAGLDTIRPYDERSEATAIELAVVFGNIARG